MSSGLNPLPVGSRTVRRFGGREGLVSGRGWGGGKKRGKKKRDFHKLLWETLISSQKLKGQKEAQTDGGESRDCFRNENGIGIGGRTTEAKPRRRENMETGLKNQEKSSYGNVQKAAAIGRKHGLGERASGVRAQMK